MIKLFDNWHNIKLRLHNKSLYIYFQEREIWWISLGCNIGDEEDGKNNLFERPVLILLKFNKNIFWGLPLSSKIKNNKFYFPIQYNGKYYSILLSQLRLFDKKRLLRKMRTITKEEFALVRKTIKNLL